MCFSELYKPLKLHNPNQTNHNSCCDFNTNKMKFPAQKVGKKSETEGAQ